MEQDNQQAKTFFNLGWIAAFLEGEGWFILNRRNFRGKHYVYTPVIGVNSTSQKLVNQLGDILRGWDVGYWTSKRKFLETKNKDQYIINVRGFKRCSKLLDKIIPYLNDKKKQAELLKEFIDYRMQFYNNRHKHCGEKEEEYRQKLQCLNRKGKASTTIH